LGLGGNLNQLEGHSMVRDLGQEGEMEPRWADEPNNHYDLDQVILEDSNSDRSEDEVLQEVNDGGVRAPALENRKARRS